MDDFSGHIIDISLNKTNTNNPILQPWNSRDDPRSPQLKGIDLEPAISIQPIAASYCEPYHILSPGMDGGYLEDK